jgi:hypothetical protein
MCLQYGFGAIGGGSIVRLQGDNGSGTLTVETLNGVRANIPARSDAGQNTLCEVRSGAMIVCPADESHTGDVSTIDALSNLNGGSGTPSGTLARGASIALWDFVHDGNGRGSAVALVTVDGREHFIADSEVCFAQTYPDASAVTTKLRMHTKWARPDPTTGGTTIVSAAAAPNTYRLRSPDMISRIVVHNTEEPFTDTMRDFTSGRNGTSAHVVLDRDGTMYRVVEDQFAAHHAGSSSDGMGNYNTATVGVEVVAYDASGFGGRPGDANFLSEVQSAALVSLIQAWMTQYSLELRGDIVRNSASLPGYADHEYASAPLTIHRLTKANRATDCPKFLFGDSRNGDEAFFRWRQQSFGR